MDDYDSLQARRQQQALKSRTRGPGAVLSTATPTTATTTTTAMMATAMPAPATPLGARTGNPETPAVTSPPGIFMPAQQASATAAAFAPGPSNLAIAGNGAAVVNFSSPLLPRSTTASDGAMPLNSADTAAAQRANAQRIAAQLQAMGIGDLVRPAGAPHGDGAEAASALAHGGGGGGERSKAAFNRGIPTDHFELLGFVPRQGLLQCFIVREKSFGFSGSAKYRMHLQKNNRFVLGSRKRSNKPTSNYLISIDAEKFERTGPEFFGKVRANFSGLEFLIYDAGESPESGRTPIRKEHGAVLYEQNVGGLKGPRRIKAVLPLLDDADRAQPWQPMAEGDSILEEYKRDPQSTKLIVLESKAPSWNEQLRAYQLNFNGRVTSTSVKNFQLCDARNPGRVVMQFGKCGENNFALDYQYPLNAFQAFAIAMTSFDNKLACD